MKIKQIVLLATASAFAAGAQVTPPTKEAPFGPGERLSYDVSYRAKLMPNTVVAQATMRTKSASVDGTPALHVNANAKIISQYRWLYELNDTYEIWLSESSLLPLRFSNNLVEGKYRFKSKYNYDWNAMKVNTTSRNQKWNADRNFSLDLTRNSMDALSFFYNLRAEDISTFTAGQERVIELVFASKVKKVMFKYVGKETIDLKKMGKYRTLKFSCQLAASDNHSFQDGSEFFVWISDDGNKVPLYVESPIFVGSIRVTVTKMDNLKYPLDSRIDK